MESRAVIDVNGLCSNLNPASVVKLPTFPGMDDIEFASLWR